MTWRERFRPLIAKTLAAVRAAGGGEAEERAALTSAYPGFRMGWAYKCWLDECARQRGRSKGRVRRATSPIVKARKAEDAGQLPLFDGRIALWEWEYPR